MAFWCGCALRHPEHSLPISKPQKQQGWAATFYSFDRNLDPWVLLGVRGGGERVWTAKSKKSYICGNRHFPSASQESFHHFTSLNRLALINNCFLEACVVTSAPPSFLVIPLYFIYKNMSSCLVLTSNLCSLLAQTRDPICLRALGGAWLKVSSGAHLLPPCNWANFKLYETFCLSIPPYQGSYVLYILLMQFCPHALWVLLSDNCISTDTACPFRHCLQDGGMNGDT